MPDKTPDFAEPHRIVAQVDELMAVLDAIAATLTAARATARATAEKLLAASVHSLHSQN